MPGLGINNSYNLENILVFCQTFIQIRETPLCKRDTVAKKGNHSTVRVSKTKISFNSLWTKQSDGQTGQKCRQSKQRTTSQKESVPFCPAEDMSTAHAEQLQTQQCCGT